MAKKLSDEERQILINKYKNKGLSETNAIKKTNKHIGLMVCSPLLMVL